MKFEIESAKLRPMLQLAVRTIKPKPMSTIEGCYKLKAVSDGLILETMDTDEPSTFSVALVPSVASSTSITDYVLRGILLGTMAVIGILVLIFLLDNRPKSPEDIMQAANIPTLAVIPSHPELSGDREHRRRRAMS